MVADVEWAAAMQQILLLRYPWLVSLRAALRDAAWEPEDPKHLLIGSDYSDGKPASKHRVFSFCVASGNFFPWNTACRHLREVHRLDGRRVSYKRLDRSFSKDFRDEFLFATNLMPGHMVSLVVEKTYLKGGKAPSIFQSPILKATWKGRSLDDMMLKASIFALIVERWGHAGADITWVSDHDSSLANPEMHDDFLCMAGALSSAFSGNRSMGTLSLTDTSWGPASLMIEDFVAVADLAAGTLNGLAQFLPPPSVDPEALMKFELPPDIPKRLAYAVDWLWSSSSNLKQSCLWVAQAGDKIAVRRISTE